MLCTEHSWEPSLFHQCSFNVPQWVRQTLSLINPAASATSYSCSAVVESRCSLKHLHRPQTLSGIMGIITGDVVPRCCYRKRLWQNYSQHGRCCSPTQLLNSS